jgi:hypothetical protein
VELGANQCRGLGEKNQGTCFMKRNESAYRRTKSMDLDKEGCVVETNDFMKG